MTEEDKGFDHVKGYLKYEKARKQLCVLARHHIPSLDLIAAMDKFTWDLLEAYENLDPNGEK